MGNKRKKFDEVRTSSCREMLVDRQVDRQTCSSQYSVLLLRVDVILGNVIHCSQFWHGLSSRVVSVLDTGAEGPGFTLQPGRCRVTVLGKLFTPIVPLFTKQRNW